MALTYSTHLGRAIAPFVADVAAFRIRGFRAFPYLYAGTEAYERDYLSGYLEDPRALLVRVADGGRTVAVATAAPLAGKGGIAAEAPALLARAGFAAKAFYYYAEILVEPEYRGRGIAKAIYAERERVARGFGFRSLCLAVVQREVAHPLRPQGYLPPERIWIRDGFRETDAVFFHCWPTIGVDGEAVEADNAMRLWVREL